MWRLDREEYYFRIFDSKKRIAGYFDPDYGDAFPKDKEQEIIEAMWENRDGIPGGYLMVGLAKFGIFDGDYSSDLRGLEGQIRSVQDRISAWKELVAFAGFGSHTVHISHTDQDMLAITLPVPFARPVPLDGGPLRDELAPVLDMLHERSLL